MNPRGVKAAGLARLPKYWTPPYVAVTADLAEVIAGAAEDRSSSAIANRLKASSKSRALARLFTASRDGIIARSSAPDEDMAARGLYRSAAATFASFQTAAEAMRDVWDHASKLDPAAANIPIIVQARVVSQLSGHLSNEVRLKRDRRDWIAEMRGELSETRALGMRALRGDRSSLTGIDLDCASPDQLRTVLRRIAGALAIPGFRVHLEWCWDGARIWILQYDRVEETRSKRPVASGTAATIPPTKVFRPLTRDDADMPKARCVAEYIAAGLPHADLAILRDRTVIGDLAVGTCPPALVTDLERLAEAGVVIRTDIRGNHDFAMLLERTQTEFSAARLAKFLVEATKRLRDQGVPASDIAFLTHAFIPADASAWSLAAPLSPEVRIDATYGLPDGLLYYSHDSYQVNLRRGTIQRRIRAKDSILECDDDGTWRTTSLGAPWDWRSSLSDDEAITVARLSKKLADALGKPVETMFFLRAHTPQRVVTALPWVHRVEGVGQAIIPATESHFASGAAVEVRSGSDLSVLREALAAVSPGERVLIRLKPEGEVLHDETFLKNVIAEMRPERCYVDMAGSALSHVYYELQRAGVQVRTADPLEPTAMEPKAFDKLVRDLIPDVIASKGERVVAYAADGQRLSHLLRRKLIEEAYEVAAAASIDHRIEELGDVLDVVDALCTISGTDLHAVKLWSETKRTERGGFERGVVLAETRDRTLDEAVAKGAPDFSLSPELGAEVERSQRSEPQKRQIDVTDEFQLAYDVPDGLPVRIVIDGVEVEIQFRREGVLIRRLDPAGENPGQLALALPPERPE
jgi:predicted house-cleaning noncanonical NTP pyrophosphatase (MazG superfamily)